MIHCKPLCQRWLPVNVYHGVVDCQQGATQAGGCADRGSGQLQAMMMGMQRGRMRPLHLEPPTGNRALTVDGFPGGTFFPEIAHVRLLVGIEVPSALDAVSPLASTCLSSQIMCNEPTSSSSKELGLSFCAWRRGDHYTGCTPVHCHVLSRHPSGIAPGMESPLGS